MISETTVVTEVRTFLVGQKGRKGIDRAAVSARSGSVTTETFDVVQQRPHIITKHPGKHLHINSIHPIRAVFVQGNAEDVIGDPGKGVYETAKIFVPDMHLNQANAISVFDQDVRTDHVEVTVFNATTGQTDIVALSSIGNGMFQGQIKLLPSQSKGPDFSGCMSAAHGHDIRVRYSDPRTETGMPAVIEAAVRVSGVVRVPELLVRTQVQAYSPIGLILRNVELPTTVLARSVHGSRLITVSASQSIVEPQGLLRDPGDELTFSYSWIDEYGNENVESVITTMTDKPTLGQVTLEGNQPLTIKLNDPDLVGETVGVIVTYEDGSWEHLRLQRDGEYTGRYSLAIVPRHLGKIEVSYRDTSTVTATHVVTGSDPEETPQPEEEAPAENRVYYPEVEFEINGLFILNGKFSGIIKLYAVEDETVRCSVIHAS